MRGNSNISTELSIGCIARSLVKVRSSLEYREWVLSADGLCRKRKLVIVLGRKRARTKRSHKYESIDDLDEGLAIKRQ